MAGQGSCPAGAANNYSEGLQNSLAVDIGSLVVDSMMISCLSALLAPDDAAQAPRQHHYPDN